MKEDKIVKHYADLLFDLCENDKQRKDVKKDVSYLLPLCADTVFNHFLHSPLYRKKTKQQCLDTIFGKEITATTLGFLRLLIEKKRLSYLPKMLSGFLKRYRSYEGRGRAHLIVAQPLNPAVEKEFVRLIKQLTQWDDVTFLVTVDPNLLGGYILQVEDKQLDVSLRRRLQNLRTYWRTPNLKNL